MRARRYALRSIVAIVTPMQDDGRLDFERFKSLIDFHIEQGTDGIVVSAPRGIAHGRCRRTQGTDPAGHCPRARPHYYRGRQGGNSTARPSSSLSRRKRRRDACLSSCLTTTSHAGGPLPALSHHRGKGGHRANRVQRSRRTVADLASETTLRLAQIRTSSHQGRYRQQ